ncbi:MAG: fused MFS/spermidine synthase, partial [Gammaproteobacteria bacterium]|nr:fused MFS/spermidine synthase [Gammaproteobacteria bacterium]
QYPRLMLGMTQVLLVLAIPYAAFTIKVVIPFLNLPWAKDAFLLANEQGGNSASWLLSSANDIVRCAVAILPATILWGASFPLALAAVRKNQDPGAFVGRIYAANTIGAIVGALIYSLVLIPETGTRFAEQSLTVLAALAALLMLSRLKSEEQLFLRLFPFGKNRKFMVTAVWVALLATSVVLSAAIPFLHPGAISYGRDVQGWNVPAEYLHNEEGISASVSVSRDAHGIRTFHISGKVVASTTHEDMRLQRMLGHFPALFHKDPKSVLIIGFGAGVTAGSFVVHPGVERIVIVEIEPVVPTVSGVYFRDENFDVLEDPRVEVIFDDARHYIATTSEQFDVITADPIHPWVKGSAALYSKEFFQLTRKRLKPGGVAAQWIPFYETSEAAVKSEIATFFSVFPEGSLWSSDRVGRGYDAVIIGGVDLSNIDFNAMHNMFFEQPALRDSLRDIDILNSMDILKTYSGQRSDMEGWLKTAQMNLDMNLRLEYLAGAALNSQVQEEIFSKMVAEINYPSNLSRLVPGDEKRYRQWFQKRFTTGTP